MPPAPPVTSIKLNNTVSYNGKKYVQLFVTGLGRESPNGAQLPRDQYPQTYPNYGTVVGWYYYYPVDEIKNGKLKRIYVYSANRTGPQSGKGFDFYYNLQTNEVGGNEFTIF